ncbi:MAG TPA: DNA methyltransferase [Verrucomicrobiae bacterium]|nr:DNA methyltransferase [Verrucomicrobiae bacterium]
MSVRVLAGDCLELLPTLDGDSVDACVTDPPYHLTSIVKRFGSSSAAPPLDYEGGSGVYKRASAGFMGKVWDGGDIAFRPDVWREVLRVLKPGGHLVAFGGSRTYHRLACAIEDAGFEIRDQIMWVYSQGFPKSLDVSKAIDKRPGVKRHAEFAVDLRAAMASSGFTNTFDVAEKVIGRRTGAVANWQKYQWPEAKWWPALRDLLGMDEAKWGHVIAEANRERIGAKSSKRLAVAPGQENDRSDIELDITAPATDAARKWQGFGTALKPAHEPIVLARKPLIGTVAANVLAHGTGALNVDGCRVEAADGVPKFTHRREDSVNCYGDGKNGSNRTGEMDTATGRWPANVIHDGSDEVVGAFPPAPGQQRSVGPANGAKPSINCYGDFGPRNQFDPRCDSGSAARFFYSAKADKDDRLASRHPTVKPVDLMAYLCRLITPPGGTVLDPFAGSGSTGMACMREGFDAILIEREAEYVADIKRRIAHVSGEDAPLFAGAAE